MIRFAEVSDGEGRLAGEDDYLVTNEDGYGRIVRDAATAEVAAELAAESLWSECDYPEVQELTVTGWDGRTRTFEVTAESVMRFTATEEL